MDTILRKEYFDKAFKLHNAGMIAEAQTFYKKILNENPQDCEVLNLMGLCELNQKRYNQAHDFVVKAIAIKQNRYFYQTLSTVYDEQKEYQKELETLLAEKELFGLTVTLAFRLGLAYKKLADFDNSIYYYQKVLEMDDSLANAYVNLASLYMQQNEYENAIKCYNKAIELVPNDDEAKYFLGICYLRLKNYENGLKYFESRLCRKTAIETERVTYPNLISDENIWHGEDISDKVLYTYYEAGYGDMIMFMRYIPILEKRCKKLIIKPQLPLCNLLRENFPNIEVMDYFVDEKDMHFDVHIPFLSIPKALGLSGKDVFVARNKYLNANKEKAKYYKKEFFNNDNYKIAIKWQGNTYYDIDRVINADAFSKLFELENTQVYSAQTFEGSEEFEKLSQQYNIIDLGKTFKDFSDTAAAIKNVDLVICNDTSLAHLAGAMGKKCVILLPYMYNWRWHNNLKYCDWYKSAKLYRLDKNETWNSLMDKVVSELVI